MKVVPIIPALNPDNKLIKLVDELKEKYHDIIIVNDGSESDEIFNKITGCTILTHDVNKGKGVALKIAFNYIKNYLNFDQLLYEYAKDGSTWIHVSYKADGNNRRQAINNYQA